MERAQFESIYVAHYDDVLRYCARRAGQAHAPDAAADTFAVAWRRRADVPEDRPLPWLYGVARRVLANDRRANGRFSRLRRKVAGAEVRPEGGPETTVVRRAEEAALGEALARLSDQDREVIRLAAWEELTRDDLGLALGCSSNTATKRLSRALDRLARELGVEDRDRSTRLIGQDRRLA